jgi:hypothetical protein
MTQRLKMESLCEENCGHMSEEMSAEIDRMLAEEIGSVECGPEGAGDEVNQAINEVVNFLTRCDYEEDVAMEAVFDALHDMLDKGEMTDVPEINAVTESKSAWVEDFQSKIKKKLEAMGLDLTPTQEDESEEEDSEDSETD